MCHRADLAIVGVLLLVAAAAPALRAKLSFPDLQSVPSGVQARAVADVVARGFTPNLDYPVTIVVSGPAQRGPSPAALALALNTVGGVAAAAPLRDRSGAIVAVQAVLRTPPLSDASRQLVERARALPGHPVVAGRTAQFLDLEHSITTRAWLAGVLAGGGHVPGAVRSHAIGRPAVEGDRLPHARARGDARPACSAVPEAGARTGRADLLPRTADARHHDHRRHRRLDIRAGRRLLDPAASASQRGAPCRPRRRRGDRAG